VTEVRQTTRSARMGVFAAAAAAAAAAAVLGTGVMHGAVHGGSKHDISWNKCKESHSAYVPTKHTSEASQHSGDTLLPTVQPVQLQTPWL
jgi:hypothetical protein